MSQFKDMRVHHTEPQLTRRDRLHFALFLAIAMVTFLLLGCGGCHMTGPTELPTTSQPAVAKLVKVEDGEEAGYCTVFKVAEDFAMTAGHCCDKVKDRTQDKLDQLIDELFGEDLGPEVITYHAVGPMAVPGAAFKIVHDDDEHDVCLMKGKLRGAPLALAAHDPAVGAPVWTAGYPKTVFLISQGLWAGRDDDGEAIASIAVWGGASGSPVLDQDSRVVGILRAYYPPMSNMAVIAPLEWVRASYAQRPRH